MKVTAAILLIRQIAGFVSDAIVADRDDIPESEIDSALDAVRQSHQDLQDAIDEARRSEAGDAG